MKKRQLLKWWFRFHSNKLKKRLGGFELKHIYAHFACFNLGHFFLFLLLNRVFCIVIAFPFYFVTFFGLMWHVWVHICAHDIVKYSMYAIWSGEDSTKVAASCPMHKLKCISRKTETSIRGDGSQEELHAIATANAPLRFLPLNRNRAKPVSETTHFFPIFAISLKWFGSNRKRNSRNACKIIGIHENEIAEAEQQNKKKTTLCALAKFQNRFVFNLCSIVHSHGECFVRLTFAIISKSVGI